MTGKLTRLTESDRRYAADVFDDFQATMAAARLILPSAGVDWRSAYTTGIVLIDLGAARPEVIESMTDFLRKGIRA